MKLTTRDPMESQRQASCRSGRADASRRARLVLLLAEGRTSADIRAKLDCADSYISRWSKRFEADRPVCAACGARALQGHGPAGGTRAGMDDQAQAGRWFDPRVLAQAGGRAGRSYLAHDGDAHLGQASTEASPSRGLHRVERPDFESKATDVMGLYPNPPQHAAVSCVDE